MDGNGRWAMRRGKPRSYGHQAGSDALKRTIEAAIRRDIEVLTVFAFSCENWRRPRTEVRKLLDLFLKALNKDVRELHQHGVRINFIGGRSVFNPSLRNGMAQAEQLTCRNQRLQLNVAVNYSGRSDIVAAARRIAAKAATGNLAAEDLTEEHLGEELTLACLPSPDLFIRTGGEKRLSNFLLWQIAYTELYFSEVLWPDFGAEALDEALMDYAGRERRFGGLSQVQSA
ncbi:di-trans,poly-cis-decaprenylcistransferase [Wenzhouxiangella sp. C33]|uniref:Ditrans,polycis-undecaprenyl-diphosphate synthase ((2E,6E)-farnesyl-diphosphate specific) n=2 Tax=Wenzhouxiangella limi TaxID=2707351 RepID=A0A845UYJ1_9GAMM|nr:di-trans,poly-cis-decaprenylcistransferase [Wenzhouxiangella limi]